MILRAKGIWQVLYGAYLDGLEIFLNPGAGKRRWRDSQASKRKFLDADYTSSRSI